MKYNPAIHHRRSIRLKGYDYSQAGLYFVTICVQNRQCVFGEIVNNEMRLNENGQIVEMVWNELPRHYNNIALGEFVIMPNHIHGIVEIHTGVDCRGADCRGAINRTPTVDGTMDETDIKNGGFAGKNNPMFYENLPRIIRLFKGRITFECRKTMPYFAWQRNYWEHIIRDEQSHQRIADYIVNNPINWEKDKFYTK